MPALDPPGSRLTIDAPVISTKRIAAAVIDHTANFKGTLTGILVVSLSITPAGFEQPKHHAILAPLHQINKMILGINRAGLTHRLEYDLMPAAGTAPFLVVLGCPDRDILFTVGTVSRFRALLAVLVENEVLRDADLTNPLVPVFGLCGSLGEVCVPWVGLTAMAHFQLIRTNALLVFQDTPVVAGLSSEIVQHCFGILFRDPTGSTHVIGLFPEEAIQLCSQPALFLVVIGNPAVRFLIHEHGIRR